MPPQQNNPGPTNPFQQNGIPNPFIKSASGNPVLEKTIDDFVKNDDVKKDESFLKPIRTYESDIAEVMKNRQGSLAKIAIAENEKQKFQSPVFMQENADEDKKKKKILVVGSLILVFLGFAVWGGFLIFKNKEEVNNFGFFFSPLFSADAQKEISIEGKTPGEITKVIKSYKDAQLSLSSVLGIYFTTGSEENKKDVTGEKFFTSLETRAPSALLRTLNGPIMYGVHSFKGSQPFIVMKTSHFENSFAGMLEWEKYIDKDLKEIIPIKDFVDFQNATSTEKFTSKNEFQDIILKNKDVRALKDASGKIVFMYSFPDRQTIIITTIPDTFEVILSKLLTVRMVR